MNFLQSITFSLRLMRRSPVVTILAVLCLAAGIGLSTFMFSITYAVVSRGLPFPEQERIITIMQQDRLQGEESRSSILVTDFREIEEQQTPFRHLTAVTSDRVTVGLPGLPHLLNGLYTSADLFSIMEENPLLGRTLGDEDTVPGADPVLLLSYKTWMNKFGADAGIIGKEVIAEGSPYTVIGVMPEGYGYPFGDTDVWLPLIPETLREQTGWIDRVILIGRLVDDVTLDAAQAELGVIFTRIQEARGESEPERIQPYLRPIIDMFLNPQLKLMMWSMFGATLLVLFIACTNVASLMTARLTARENELAIRSALGANRKRIVTQILSESLLVATLGAAIGLLVASKALKLLWNQLDSFRFSPPSFMEFRMDGISLIVAVGLMLLAVLISSLLPALRASRPNLGALLNDSGRTSSNLRMSRLGTLSPIIQLALSLALLVAAGKFVYGIVVVSSADYPFEKSGLLIGSVAIDSASYPTPEGQRIFWEEMHRKLKQVPGANSVSLGFNIPTTPGMSDPIAIDGVDYDSEDDRPVVRFNVVTPGYFETLGVSLLKGRDFNGTDIKGNESVMIINKVMADRFWPGKDPVGNFVITTDRGGLSEEERKHRIIGVVPDLAMHGLFNEEEDGSGFYRSQGQSLWGDQKIIIRTGGNPNALIPEVQRIITLLDPDIAFTDAQSFEEHVQDTFFFFRFFLNLFSTFGIMALFLASTGVFGIIQFTVSQRQAEIGIRLALGATASNIRWLILKRGIRNAVIGILLGSVLSFLLSKVLASIFPFMEKEYISYALSVLVLLLVAILANLLPAQRASRLDPMVALRVK